MVMEKRTSIRRQTATTGWGVKPLSARTVSWPLAPPGETRTRDRQLLSPYYRIKFHCPRIPKFLLSIEKWGWCI